MVIKAPYLYLLIFSSVCNLLVSATERETLHKKVFNAFLKNLKSLKTYGGKYTHWIQ